MRSSLRLRSFQAGDERVLAELWGRAYAGYCGYVPRTPAYWRWCILDRPGLSAEDILVVERKHTVVGYAVLDPDGNVLELAVDPNSRTRVQRQSASLLIRALEERGQQRCLEQLRFRLPRTERILDRALSKHGYRASTCDSLQFVIVDLRQFLELTLRNASTTWPEGWDRRFDLVLSPGEYHFAPHRHLVIDTRPPVTVRVDAVGSNANPTLECSVTTLTEVVFRLRAPGDVISEGLVRLTPHDSADLATLLNSLTLTQPWFTPYADFR